MKIALLIPHIRIAGGVRVSITYATLLKQFGYEVTVVVPYQPLLNRAAFTAIHFTPQWAGTNVPFRYVRRITRSVVERYGVVIADSWQLAREIISLDIPGRRMHLIQHDERLYHGNWSEVSRVYASELEKITVSSWLQETLRRDFNKNSHLLLNSFDRNLFYPTSGASAERSHTFRILVLSHPYPWKGTQEAISIVQSLKQTYPHVRLVGFGARHSGFDALFDEFHFQPPKNEFALLYGGVDLFLCTSWDEGFGLPSLEAMACGTPVVTYDNGGSRDFAHHNDTALVAPHQDKDTLQKYVERIIIDESLRTKLRENALRLTASWPTWEEQTKKLEKIICQM